jgi:hypothetical protein
VNTLTGQAGSRHRHSRARHTSRTRIPKQEASATTRRRRPWPTGTTPHARAAADVGGSLDAQHYPGRLAVDGQDVHARRVDQGVGERAPQRARGARRMIHGEAFSSINCLVADDLEGLDTLIPRPPRPRRSDPSLRSDPKSLQKGFESHEEWASSTSRASARPSSDAATQHRRHDGHPSSSASRL